MPLKALRTLVDPVAPVGLVALSFTNPSAYGTSPNLERGCSEVAGSSRYLTTKKAESLLTFGLSAVWTGLEPATSCVTGRHSNQLNYHTVFCLKRYKSNTYFLFCKPLDNFFLIF